MTDAHSNPRHKIEAIKELRQAATAGSSTDNPTQGEKFLITINLGTDCVERYEFDIAPNKPSQLEEKPDVDE
jgi:hypothetical protein